MAAICLGAFYIYADSLINTGTSGNISQSLATDASLQKKEIGLLFVGIDYTVSDAELVQRDPIGQADTIMYVKIDYERNSMYMLQVPRDLFVGDALPTGGSGKINALYKHATDEENRIDALAQPLSDMLQLPIDAYVCVDMHSLTEIVDILGGINVHVPVDMEHDGSFLPAGVHNLSGASLEFFLRDRSTPTGDIARLETQRYFYAALFSRLKATSIPEMLTLAPVVSEHMNTDISVAQAILLALRVTDMPKENIMLCTLPTYDSTQHYNSNHAVQVADTNATADLLNEYFRQNAQAVPAEELNFADWPHGSVSHDANVQFMTGY